MSLNEAMTVLRAAGIISSLHGDGLPPKVHQNMVRLRGVAQQLLIEGRDAEATATAVVLHGLLLKLEE